MSPRLQYALHRYRREVSETVRIITAENALRELRSAGYTYMFGRDITQLVLREKQVPAARLRAYEKAFREFNRIRYPKRFVQWFSKNLPSIELLLEVGEWPAKGADTGRALVVDNFTLHNQTAQDPAASIELVKRSAEAIRVSGIPRAEEILYGDVYVVGEIERKKTIAARYDHENDQVFVLLVKRFAVYYEQAFVHELGHRYYDRILTDKQKHAWEKHHSRLLGLGRFERVELPALGDRLEFVDDSPVVVGFMPGQQKIVVEASGGRKGMIGIRAYEQLVRRLQQQKRFPTPYSMTNAEEHFCEAFALYAMRTLGQEHREALDLLLHGPEVNPYPKRGVFFDLHLFQRMMHP